MNKERIVPQPGTVFFEDSFRILFFATSVIGLDAATLPSSLRSTIRCERQYTKKMGNETERKSALNSILLFFSSSSRRVADFAIAAPCSRASQWRTRRIERVTRRSFFSRSVPLRIRFRTALLRVQRKHQELSAYCLKNLFLFHCLFILIFIIAWHNAACFRCSVTCCNAWQQM